ncbi:MAG: S-layer homology domain-containing protein [Oscillospiraceae bacterium]
MDHYDASNSSAAAVTGGKFDADISKYIPTDYVQSADGTVEKLGETNAVAKVGGTYYKTLADAVAAAQDGDTITLLKDAELTSTLNLAKNITIDGQGKYTIKAANSFTVGSDNKTYCVLYVSGEVTLKDVTVNGNEKCRVIFCDKGKLTIDGATITNGKAPNFIGGVYMTSSASFEMKSGSITGNKNAKGYQNDEYLQYSSDLWIGANANGALTAINGGTIGNVFVNANAWSASNPGSFTMNGGTVTNLYVEHDANYGATFKYNDGTIEHLYLSKENGNGQSIEVTPVKGVIYNGGVKEQDLVTLTMKYNDGATADSTYNVASGTTITLPTPRRSGYTFNGWYDGSKFYAAGASYTVSATVTLNASWSYISSGSSYDPTYSVSTPSKTEHGTVTVSPKSASKGDTVTVTVKPDSGYVLETLTVTDKNGNELTLKDKGNGKYTFTMPAGKVEVKATFMEDNSMLNFFYDVPNNAYFYEAVKWAVKNGITDGVGNNLFAPEQPCTRAQIVTFLWRAAGSPEPKGAASGMTDVVSGSYYEKAVAWAIENGITTGTTTSTFSPDATCTRAQAVTFLARALKAKAASAAEFSDVPTGSYFADAVAWAAANGVTEGIGGGLFGSDNDCTRGQIVTFLYRAYNK